MRFKGIVNKLLRFVVRTKRRFNDRVVNKGLHTGEIVFHKGYEITGGVIPVLCTVLFGLMIYDVGFNKFNDSTSFAFEVIREVTLVLLISVIFRFIFEWGDKRTWVAHVYSFFFVVIMYYMYDLILTLQNWHVPIGREFQIRKLGVFAGIVFVFLSEVSHVLRFIYRKSVNPSFIFVASFAIFIGIGALLLMLPNATTGGITTIDAFFTSASAICVTGLAVVDTGTHFTLMGQIIILVLIQIGGLGFMTFTGLLGYLAAGSVSFQGQLLLKDMLYTQQINNVIQLIIRIILVTFIFEIIGFLAILSTLTKDLFDTEFQRVFFALFHSVSAFCNAGFSTLSNGLYDRGYRFNYSFQIIIAMLIILGGLGFPIVFNIYTYVRIKVSNFVRRLLGDPYQENFTRVLQISSRLALGCSTILLVVGFASFFYFEQHTTLNEHHTIWGKVVTSFFGSVTPRTAGFNTVNMASMTLPTVMIFLLLMWIGASPGSTGGGIKTTTAAVAALNMVSVIRGKDRTEFHRTQISEHAVKKAFAIILLSLLIIGSSIFLISLNDADKGLLEIAFESFSAFSTVGLTLGITPGLSGISKTVLIVVMFIGRVGALTVIVAFVNQSKQLYYRYPTEDIIY